jgi:hypothetical protein
MPALLPMMLPPRKVMLLLPETHSSALRLLYCNPVTLMLLNTAWPQMVKRHLAALQEPAPAK